MKNKFLILFFSTLCSVTLTAQKYDVDSIYADNVYWKRMQLLNTTIKPFFDEQIEGEIKEMLHNPSTPKALSQYLYYKDTIASIFKRYGLPAELQLVAFANTYMNESNVEPTGETGMWPLSYFIGKKYQLTINSFVDERRNFFESTNVASNSLADLYHIYKDWYFTIAAFKSGPVEMNKAVRLASNTLDYFIVEPYIDYSYRKAFSRFMASLYVANYYQLHNVKVPVLKIPQLDTVLTPRTFSFQRISMASNTPLQLVKAYNPQYKNEIVPNFPYPHPITSSLKGKDSFKKYLVYLEIEEENKRINDSLDRVKFLIEKYNPDSTQYKVLVLDGKLSVIDSLGNLVDVDKPLVIDKELNQAIEENGTRWVYYTVKSGDNLGLLSDCFDASQADIKRWNKLKGTTLMKNQKLKFLVPASKYSKYSGINKMTNAQKQKLRKKV